MHAFRALRALTITLLAVGLAAPTAIAATTVAVDRTSDINLDALAFGVTATCGFTVELHTVGREVVISRHQDGVLVSETRQAVYHGVLLNPANGRTVATKVAGPERTVYAADGTVIATLTGSTHRNVPGAGLVSGFIGRSWVVLAPTGEIDPDGWPVYEVLDESTSGQWLGNAGLCEHLA